MMCDHCSIEFNTESALTSHLYDVIKQQAEDLSKAYEVKGEISDDDLAQLGEQYANGRNETYD